MAVYESTSTTRAIPHWALGFGILASLLLAIGAGVSLLAPLRLAPPGTEMNAAVRIYAGYTFSRDLSLMVMLSFALAKRSRLIFSIAMGIFSLVNLLDAAMDAVELRFPIVVIALLLSLLAGVASRSAANLSKIE